jgi:hypothetical protein
MATVARSKSTVRRGTRSSTTPRAGSSPWPAPTPPFPPAIRHDTDILEITRTWNFTQQRQPGDQGGESPMTDRYCVFGNPVGHSKSPAIHAAFAAQCRAGSQLRGDPRAARRLCRRAYAAFVAAGGRGANVTVPFKEEACRLATRLTARAELAGAVNTLVFRSAPACSVTTPTAPACCVTSRSTWAAGSRASACCCSAQAARRAASSGRCSTPAPAALVIANRTAARAHALAQRFAGTQSVRRCAYPNSPANPSTW